MEKEINYLNFIPQKNFSWRLEKQLVVLEVTNKGVFNRIFQKLLKKPAVSYIHLDKMGSFIWCLTDGDKTIEQISASVKEEFGDEAEPLYERLIKYFQILESYNFIKCKKRRNSNDSTRDN